MIEKEYLKTLAGKLMFDMNDEEYETLQKEFDIILKQMDLIGKIEGIKDVKPMTYQAKLRKDVVKDELSVEDVLKNAKKTDRDSIKVPKVVE